LTGEAVQLRASLDLRYIGQWHELTVAVELPLDVDAADADFHAEHDRLFGHASPGAPVELLAARLSAVGRTEKPELVAGLDGPAGDARSGERPVWDPAARALEPTPVWDGERLVVASRLTGPAIVELTSTTIVVPRGFTLEVDAHGGFAVHRGERGGESSRPLEGAGFL
jgi:N-methylhydantoinase A